MRLKVNNTDIREKLKAAGVPTSRENIRAYRLHLENAANAFVGALFQDESDRDVREAVETMREFVTPPGHAGR